MPLTKRVLLTETLTDRILSQHDDNDNKTKLSDDHHLLPSLTFRPPRIQPFTFIAFTISLSTIHSPIGRFRGRLGESRMNVCATSDLGNSMRIYASNEFSSISINDSDGREN